LYYVRVRLGQSLDRAPRLGQPTGPGAAATCPRASRSEVK